MDYSRIYIELMERASIREIEGYVEKHHIVPRCMGGDNKPRNLVKLTPEEHYLAHQLLVKIYPENNGLVFAAQAMTASRHGQRSNNRRYGWLRRKHSVAMSKLRKGKKHSAQTKQRISESNRGNTSWNKGGKISEETRSRMSKAQKNKVPVSDETRLKMSEGQKNRLAMSEETKKKISETLKNKGPRSEETKIRISKALKGNKPMSDETKRKISETAKRKREDKQKQKS